MKIKLPRNTDKLVWTNHVVRKMRYYRLSESRVKRVMNNSKRKELGIAPGTIAVMQPSGSKKHPTEIWVMYQVIKSKKRDKPSKVRIITAWRYPGKSPVNGPVPIPGEILEELGEKINN